LEEDGSVGQVNGDCCCKVISSQIDVHFPFVQIFDFQIHALLFTTILLVIKSNTENDSLRMCLMSDSILIGFIDSLDKFFFLFSYAQTIRSGICIYGIGFISRSSWFFELSPMLHSNMPVDVSMMLLTMIPVIETTIKQFLTRAFGVDFRFSFSFLPFIVGGFFIDRLGLAMVNLNC
jgi:hypothetical protein